MLNKLKAILPPWLPSRGNMIFTLVVVVSLFWAQSAGALPGQAPAQGPSASTSVIPYQGRLADSGGVPLTGTYTMVFRLYTAASGGVPVWEEQWTGPNGVAVSDGLFNVLLGSITPIPPSVITSNTALWLGITVNTDNEMTPRVQLGSVPYSVFALNVADNTIATVKLQDGAVTQAKIADDAVTAAKIAAGAVGTSEIADGAVTQAKLGADVSLIPPDGSITTAKLADSAVISAKITDGGIATADLADGAVTSRKFKPLGGVAYNTSGSIGISATHQDVPGTSRTIVVDVPSTIFINAVFDFRLSGTNPSACGVVKIDGAEVGPATNLAGNGVRAAIPTFLAVDVAAGSHTIVLVAFGNPGTQTLLDTTGYTYWVMAR